MALFKKKAKNPKKKGRPTSMVVWAIIIGVLAAMLAGLYIKQRADAYLASLKHREAREVAIVVAARDLGVGDIVSGATVAIRQIPADIVPSGALLPQHFTNYEGRVLIEPVAKGTPVLEVFIADGVSIDFSDTIDQGRRAMTIEVDELKSIGGLARPGNFIDIYAHLPPGVQSASDKKDVVMPVLQDVKVLATARETHKDYQEKILQGGRGQAPNQRFTNITLDVSPKQAALLAQAGDKGDLFTLLRNRKDRGGADFAEILPADLFSNAAQMAKDSAVRNAARSLDNLVVRDGKIYTADGIEVKDPNLIVKDGVIMTKDGVVLSGKGLVIDKDGNIRTADGRKISAGDVVISANGKVMTKDGAVLGDDVKLTKSGLLVASDGTVMTKDGRVLGKNIKLNKDGLLVAEDGAVMTKDGQVLGKVTKTKGGFYVDANGRVMTKDGVVLEGVTVNERGEVVTANGKVLNAKNIVVNADGSITDKRGRRIAGVSGRKLPSVKGGSDTVAAIIEFLAGGVSKDGVATVGQLPVLK